MTRSVMPDPAFAEARAESPRLIWALTAHIRPGSLGRPSDCAGQLAADDDRVR